MRSISNPQKLKAAGAITEQLRREITEEPPVTRLAGAEASGGSVLSTTIISSRSQHLF
jgi:hypothetical protein